MGGSCKAGASEEASGESQTAGRGGEQKRAEGERAEGERREVERLSRLVWQQAERVEEVVKASTRQRAGAWGVMALVMATLLHLALGAMLGGVCRQNLRGEL